MYKYLFLFPGYGYMTAITVRHTFGWKMEGVLKPYLEEILDEPIVKSGSRFDTIDFKGAYWNVELKSRPAISEKGYKQTSDTYNTWYLPTSKETLAESSDGELIFFYYWEGDNSLWYVKYDRELFSTFKRERLWFHPTKQEHWYVPKSAFERLDITIE